MKKALALLLSIIAVFSMFGVVACAEEKVDPSNLVAVMFCVKEENGNEKVLEIGYYKAGEILEEDKFPAHPVKESTATTEYIFKGWRCSLDGELYYMNGPYAISETAKNGDSIRFVAEYSEKEITATQSFWNFVESVFARINMIFQYFAKIFEW